MGIILEDLAIETTRRCNLKCDHCMRWVSQNIDLTPEIVDYILENDEIKRINFICFSGGEPTLNPNIIIYTINKIITDNLDVCEIAMVTNGQIFNRELVETFNKFNEYRNKRLKESLKIRPSRLDDSLLKKLIKINMNNHARITFSTDKFHKPVNLEVKSNYHKYSKGLEITNYEVQDENIYKTGFATFGGDFEYELDRCSYYEADSDFVILDNIYITATGYITSEGMGQYIDMDKTNIGHISNTSLMEVLAKYGDPIFDARKVMDYKKK